MLRGSIKEISLRSASSLTALFSARDHWIDIVVENVGASAIEWAEGHSLTVATRWYSANGPVAQVDEGTRAHFNALLPGQPQTATLRIRTPDVCGPAVLRISCLCDEEFWFFERFETGWVDLHLELVSPTAWPSDVQGGRESIALRGSVAAISLQRAIQTASLKCETIEAPLAEDPAAEVRTAEPAIATEQGFARQDDVTPEVHAVQQASADEVMGVALQLFPTAATGSTPVFQWLRHPLKSLKAFLLWVLDNSAIAQDLRVLRQENAALAVQIEGLDRAIEGLRAATAEARAQQDSDRAVLQNNLIGELGALIETKSREDQHVLRDVGRTIADAVEDGARQLPDIRKDIASLARMVPRQDIASLALLIESSLDELKGVNIPVLSAIDALGKTGLHNADLLQSALEEHLSALQSVAEDYRGELAGVAKRVDLHRQEARQIMPTVNKQSDEIALLRRVVENQVAATHAVNSQVQQQKRESTQIRNAVSGYLVEFESLRTMLLDGRRAADAVAAETADLFLDLRAALDNLGSESERLRLSFDRQIAKTREIADQIVAHRTEAASVANAIHEYGGQLSSLNEFALDNQTEVGAFMVRVYESFATLHAALEAFTSAQGEALATASDIQRHNVGLSAEIHRDLTALMADHQNSHALVEAIEVVADNVREIETALKAQASEAQASENSIVALLQGDLNNLKILLDNSHAALQAIAENSAQIDAQASDIRQVLEQQYATTCEVFDRNIADLSATLSTSLDYASARSEYLIHRQVIPIPKVGHVLTRNELGFFAIPEADVETIAFFASGQLPEPGSISVLRRLLKNGATFVDVGANVGLFTVAAARQVGPTGKIISIEPAPGTAAALQMTARLNGIYPFTQIHRLAAGREDGEAELNLGQICGHSSLFPLKGAAGTATVQVAALDPIIGPNPVDLIKIDVEGAELDVLEGLPMTLSRNPNLAIIIEFAPIHLSRAGRSISDWEEILDRHGFRAFAIDELTGALEHKELRDLMAVHSVNLLLSRSNQPGLGDG